MEEIGKNDVRMSFGICEHCGKPACVLQGGYLKPEELDALGLDKVPAKHPDNPPDVRIHEFKNLPEAMRRYAGWIDDPRLKPGMLKDYAIIRRKSQDQN